MDWGELEKRYICDFQETNISLRDWCHNNNVKYNTARRYIKPQKIKQLHSHSSNNSICASETYSAVRTQHLGYSQYIAPQYVEVASQITSLEDELKLTRAMLAYQADRLKWLHEEGLTPDNITDQLKLFKSTLPLYDLIDRTTGRVASLELSIAKLEQVKQSIEKDQAQKELILATLEQRKQAQEADHVTYHINW